VRLRLDQEGRRGDYGVESTLFSDIVCDFLPAKSVPFYSVVTVVVVVVVVAM